MPDNITFPVQTRELTGKKVNRLRREAIVPGNVYFAGTESAHIKFDDIAFSKLYDQVGDTGLLYLDVEGEKKQRPVLVEEVQLHPVSDRVLHVSFKQVDLTETIEAEVPVEMVGENDVPEATVVMVNPIITVEALPTDIPEAFEVDISTLEEIGQAITYNDLDYDKDKVSLVIDEELMDRPVILLQAIQEEEEEPVNEELDALLDDVDEAAEDAAEAAEEADQAEGEEKKE